jgi:hypothetical protein
MGEIIDKVKEKAKDAKDKVVDNTKDAKDKVVDTTKDAKDKAKDTVSSATSSSSSPQGRDFEEGTAGTDRTRKDDPLTEYKEKEPMTPAKIKEHEPTAVKRDPSDQKITEQGQTGTETKEAKEEYRKRGMTKTDSNAL